MGVGSPEELKETLGMDVDEIISISEHLKGEDIGHILPSVGACYSGLGLGTYTTNLLPQD